MSSTSPRQPLPTAWVERIFAKLTLVYGRDFLARWEGIDLRDVQADWARELAGLSGASIAHALGTLPPERPPTVLAFRALAAHAPHDAPLALDFPKADQAVVEKALSSLNKKQDFDFKRWARRLKAREEDGDRLSLFQKAAWREALYERLQPSEDWENAA